MVTVADLLLPKKGIAVPKPPSWLRGDWRFSEGSGLFLGDKSRYRNKGTIVNAAWSTDRKPGCLSFDGSGDYVTVPDQPSLNITDALTIEAWVNPSLMTGSPALRAIVSKGVYSESYVLYFYVGVGFAARVNNTVEPSCSYTGFGSWDHIIFTYSRSQKYGVIFLNGVEGTRKNYSTAIGTNTDALLIGEERIPSASRRLTGFVSGLRILGVALTASEAKARYNATK